MNDTFLLWIYSFETTACSVILCVARLSGMSNIASRINGLADGKYVDISEKI